MTGNYRHGSWVGGGLPLPGAQRSTVVTWALLAINALVWVITENAGGSQNPQTLLAFGAMFGPLIADGEYWRLFTAMFLHVGIMHLLFNGFGLLIFGRLVERIYGHARFIIIYILAGLSGSVASFTFNEVAIGAGASGAIFGVLAALAAFFIVRRKMLGAMGRQNLTGILILAAINLVFGFTQPSVDNWAHMGGFAGGLLLGAAFAPRYRYQEVANGLSVSYRVVDTSSFIKQAWVLPVMIAALSAGVWFGVSTVPTTASSHLTRAERLIEEEAYFDALSEVREAIEVDPTSGHAFFLRGKIMAELGDQERARSDLTAAIRLGLDPDRQDEAIALLVSLDRL